MNRIVIFSGSAHRALAEEVCENLGLHLSESSTNRFSNDCLQVQLKANCREADVYIVQPLSPPVQENLMELLLMLDAARGASAARSTAVIPYFSYSRSDKKDAPRISIAARLVADLLVTAGANRVLTLQLHKSQVHGFFSVPVDHLNALRILAHHFAGRDLENTVVVSPDLGNARDATAFARLLELPVAAGTKRRISDEEVIIDNIVGDVDGKNVIIMDDEIATGGSVIELMDRLRERNTQTITVVCTHGVFTGTSFERFQAVSEIEEIVTTNTVPFKEEKIPDNLTILSIAPLLAETIHRIHSGESVSSLFS
ncbi:MAG: ribose-phosphate pyrophosphokinase [Gemmatimonadota bacterium]|nr:ribose-phosphate pyrophosphokinase [Gemmatimonadota bacterium]